METETFTVTYQPTNGGESSVTVGSTGKFVCMTLLRAQGFIASCLDDMVPIPEEDAS